MARRQVEQQTAQRQLANGEAGKQGAKNYADALWGAGYITDPAFAEYATEMFSRLHARITMLNERVDGLQRQLEQSPPKNELALNCPPVGVIDAQTLRQVCQQVAKKHNFTEGTLKSPQRHKDIVRARHEAFYESKKLGKSTTQIGRFYARDHSTVLHGIKQHKQRMEAAE